jgi:hypothetical protein
LRLVRLIGFDISIRSMDRSSVSVACGSFSLVAPVSVLA